MGLFDEIDDADKNAAVNQVAKGFGVPENDIADAFEKLVPALAGGIRRRTDSDEGMDRFVNALERDRHERYLERPETLTRQETVDDGNDILGHIFGSKEVSREVAERAARDTKLSPEMLKKLLPIVASVSMGAVKKRARQDGLLDQLKNRSAPLGQRRSPLDNVLDGGGRGSVVDDILDRLIR